VSEFVLEIADAPVDWTADLPAIMSYRLVRRRRLPRWQRKGPKGRATFARRPEKNTPFLSVEETEKVLRDLEESFRNVLIERSQTWFDEAELALWRSERTAEQSRAAEKTQHPSGAARMPAFRSPVKQAVADYLQWNRAASNQELRRHLNESRPNVVPDTWKDDEKLADDTFTKVRRALGIRR